MSQVTLRGVPIEFPFEPYQLQKDYMEKVLECLQTESHGILESPTGTGKTLSLLCSSLAWIQLKKAQLQAQRLAGPSGEDNEFLFAIKTELDEKAGKQATGRQFLGLPTIIYGSRTHTQLSQAMQELKRTSYKHMKANVLGSRDQLCIHPEVMAESNRSMAIQMCKLKVSSRCCQFNNRVEQKKQDPAITDLSVIDIEDIVKLGQKHRFCPYYMTKELKQQADIVFTPYNYLFDPLARKALGVELANNVIILDEAHNIESTCEESASMDIKTTDIALAIEEVTAVMKIISDMPLSFDDSPKDFGPEDLCALKEVLLDFEKQMDAVELKKNNDGITAFPGSYIYELLSLANIKHENAWPIINLVDKIIQFLASVNEGPFARKGVGLQTFCDFLRIVFAGNTEEFKAKTERCYKVHIQIEEQKPSKQNTWMSKTTIKKGCRILSYWCFSPGFGMNMVLDKGVRCVILTSGTLAPLKPLITELEMKVNICLENPHIVKGDQICVKIVPAGPDQEPLNSSYQNRENPRYLSSLGRAILNLSRIIPDGLLIFFPSYPVMQKCKDAWQSEGLWGSITSQKAIYVEPRDKNSFQSAMSEYYAKLQDPNLKGAIFMGVCRGKVSEGLDFVDANGRAVIITGLPYPPLRDPRVILKRRYLDACNSKDKEYPKGEEWYSLEATRAVNQAVGRVIRHKNDYGAILLLDNRFNSPRVRNQMSLWLRGHIKVANNFGEIIRDLSKFFRNAKNTLPTPQPKITNPGPAEFDTVNTYKKGNFDFSTSSLASFSENSISTSDDLNPNGSVAIHKRNMELSSNPPKRRKINLIPNKSVDIDLSGSTTTIEFMAMVKKVFDNETFAQFVDAMRRYKENVNFVELKILLDRIFKDRPTQRYILLGLKPYIKTKHKYDFETYCQSMT